MITLDLESLNEQQKQAVTHQNGPLLIVAGAGTGKTMVVTKRVAWLIERGLAKSDEILCLTFTDKAAGEMEERIDKLLPYGYTDLWVMTFHAFCEKLLKSHGIAMGLPSDFKVLDQTGQFILMNKIFTQMRFDQYKPQGKPTRLIASLLTHFSRAKDEGITAQQYLDYVEDLRLDSDSAEFMQFGRTVKEDNHNNLKELWTQEISARQEIAQAYHVYQKAMLENDSVDFGDLIVYAKQLLEQRPLVLEQLRKQFKYILVDEFQDTNWAQYDLVKLLASPQNNITVVGDDDQSIYKFRGASISNILGFKNDFPDCRQIVLTENYRSKQGILDLSYEFIQNNNPDRLEYALNHDQGLIKKAREKQVKLDGFEKINKKLRAHLPGAAKIDHLHFQTLEDEATGVVKKILEIKKGDPDLLWSDFAVLVRANSQAASFIQQLTVAEIPYQFLASQGLFNKPAILDLLAYFNVLYQYAESKAVYRLLILPTIDLSNDDLMKLLHNSDKKTESLFMSVKKAANLQLSEDGVKKCVKLESVLETHAKLAREKSVSEMAMKFIDEFGLKQYYEQTHPLQQREIYQYLNRFWKIMRDFESEDDQKNVAAFLRYFDLMKQAGDSGSIPQDMEIGPDTVKIMTIHGSKGLEFKYVFLVNMVDRRFPSAQRSDVLPLPEALIKEISNEDQKLAHLQEERRLCYVGITRAKEGIFFTSALDYGGARTKKLSRFLSEMNFEAKDPIVLENSQWDSIFSISSELKKAREIDYAKYLPKTFSFSQLKAFQTCPWQYRYSFIMKITVRGRHTFSFGKTMHKTLQIFFDQMIEQQNSRQSDLFGGTVKKNQDVKFSVEDLLKLYRENWIDEWYLDQKQKDEFKQKGKVILRKFYDIHQQAWPVVKVTEKPFTIKIGQYSLRGVIDRIDKLENGVGLLDYKTGKKPTNPEKDQLLLYQMAAEEVLGHKVEKLSYYYLNENEEFSFLGTDKQKEKLEEKFIETIEQLKTGRFDPKPSQIVCSNCDFADICPYKIS